MSAKKITLIASDIGTGRGGIQAWGHYLEKFFQHCNLRYSVCVLMRNRLHSLLVLFHAWITANVFVFLDWRKALMIVPLLPLCVSGLRRARFCVIIHGDEIIRTGKFGFFLKWMLRSKRFEFICNSIAVSDLLKASHGRAADYVCYPFVDTQSIIAASRVRRKRAGSYSLITVTRLAPRKNVITVVRAVAQLRAAGLAVEYDIIGDGPERAAIAEEITRLKLLRHVRLHGRVDDARKAALLSRADCFVLPSVYDEATGSIEGFGMVFIEANAAGLPVISGNTGGMVEAVQHGKTGFHTDGSEKEVLRAVRRVMKTSFSTGRLQKFAQRFDYRNQEPFRDYLLR